MQKLEQTTAKLLLKEISSSNDLMREALLQLNQINIIQTKQINRLNAFKKNELSADEEKKIRGNIIKNAAIIKNHLEVLQRFQINLNKIVVTHLN